MEWPTSWMWASTIAASASLVVPWFLPATKRHFSLLVLAASLVIYATYEWIVQSRAVGVVGALIRIDLLWLLPLIGAGTLTCIGAARNRVAE